MNPALDHLEADLDRNTEIVARWAMYPSGDGLDKLVTRGVVTRLSSNYIRPMFQVMDDESAQPARSIPCQRCADLSRSWNCPEHEEAADDEL